MIGDISASEETDDPRNHGQKLIANTYLIVDSDNGGVHHTDVHHYLEVNKEVLKVEFAYHSRNRPQCSSWYNL